MARDTYLEVESEELDLVEESQGDIEYVQESNEPTAEELEVAKLLQGNPNTFDNISVAVFKSLAAKGLAADAGDEGWMRGFKWHNYLP